jgi:hypothetical protein
MLSKKMEELRTFANGVGRQKLSKSLDFPEEPLFVRNDFVEKGHQPAVQRFSIRLNRNARDSL